MEASALPDGSPHAASTTADCEANTAAPRFQQLSLQAIALHAPVLFLHPQETYMPCSAPWFLERCELRLQPGGPDGAGPWVTLLSSGQVTKQALLDAERQHGPKVHELVLWLDAKHWQGPAAEDLDSQVPLYVNAKLIVDEGGVAEAYEINYINFHGYNGCYNIFGMPFIQSGAHVGDWEHTTVRLGASDLSLLGVWYNAHRNLEGEWAAAGEVPRNAEGRIASFVALHGHGNYPREGITPRIFFAANDRTSRAGPVWSPSVLHLMCGLVSAIPAGGRGGRIRTAAAASASPITHPTGTASPAAALASPAPPSMQAPPEPASTALSEVPGAADTAPSHGPAGAATASPGSDSPPATLSAPDTAETVPPSRHTPPSSAGWMLPAATEEVALPEGSPPSHHPATALLHGQTPSSQPAHSASPSSPTPSGAAACLQAGTDSVGDRRSRQTDPGPGSAAEQLGTASGACTIAMQAARSSVAGQCGSSGPIAVGGTAGDASSGQGCEGEPGPVAAAAVTAAAGAAGAGAAGAAGAAAGAAGAAGAAAAGAAAAAAAAAVTAAAAGAAGPAVTAAAAGAAAAGAAAACGEAVVGGVCQIGGVAVRGPLPRVVLDYGSWQRFTGQWGTSPSPAAQDWFTDAEPPVSRGWVKRIWLPLAPGTRCLPPNAATAPRPPPVSGMTQFLNHLAPKGGAAKDLCLHSCTVCLFPTHSCSCATPDSAPGNGRSVGHSGAAGDQVKSAGGVAAAGARGWDDVPAPESGVAAAGARGWDDVPAPESGVAAAALQATFLNLVVLRLRLHLPGDVQPEGDLDLCSLTFPNLRELTMTNNLADRLVLDEAHYPQLRALRTERTCRTLMLQGLQLQLPKLLALELEGACLGSVRALTDCLSAAACPRLRRFRAVDVRFLVSPGPVEMVLDLPWVEHVEIQDSTLTLLELRAPRLTELQLIHCYSLESVALLPDGDPPAVDMFADAADAAVVVPVSTSVEDMADAERMRRDPLLDILGLRVPVAPRRCMPCAAGRVALVLCNNGAWRGSEGFTTLTEDPRIFRVDDQEYEQPDSEPADSVFEGEEYDEYEGVEE
ncbi:MAG: hypothetical protein WDW36_007431 [Sanguina aurantia]